MKKFLFGVATAAAMFAANASHAISVQLDVFDNTAAFYGTINAGNSTDVSGTWVPFQNAMSTYTGNSAGSWRSPFDEVSSGAPDGVDSLLANAANVPFYSFGGNTVRGAALLFSEVQSSLSFLWGSPDDHNLVTFWLGGSVVDTFQGTPVTGGSSAGSVWATFTGAFDRVDFNTKNGANAFELASVQSTVAPVPLPAGAWMLLAAIGGFGFVARRKKQAAAAA